MVKTAGTSLGDMRARAEASTPFLSVDRDENEQVNLYGEDGFWVGVLPHQCVRSVGEQQERNAEFFAAARVDVLALLGVVEALPRCGVSPCTDFATKCTGWGALFCDRCAPSRATDLPWAGALRPLVK